MILGIVTPNGLPTLTLPIAGQSWTALVDTGFNGDLELPDGLKSALNARFDGQIRSHLAGGQEIVEDVFLVDFPFDGKAVLAEATFVPSGEILIGTHLLRPYRLTIDFPAGTVALERVI